MVLTRSRVPNLALLGFNRLHLVSLVSGPKAKWVLEALSEVTSVFPEAGGASCLLVCFLKQRVVFPFDRVVPILGTVVLPPWRGSASFDRVALFL